MKAELGEKLSELGNKALVGLLCLTGAAGVYWMQTNLSVVEKVEPITVPADAVKISDELDTSTVFRMKFSEATQAFCGKLIVKLGFDDTLDKNVTDLKNGQALVECGTDGRPIPIERIP